MTVIPYYVSSVFSNHMLNTYTLVWKPFKFCYAIKIKCVFWKQEALTEQTTVPQRDIGSSYETDEMKPLHCQLNQSLCEVSSNETSCTMSKDLADCVVEDSEDEVEVVSIRTRRQLMRNCKASTCVF